MRTKEQQSEDVSTSVGVSTNSAAFFATTSSHSSTDSSADSSEKSTSGRPRADSIEDTSQDEDYHKQKREYIKFKNRWLLHRSHLIESERHKLREFNHLLHARVDGLFQAIKAIGSEKVTPELKLVTTVMSASLKFIPYVGAIISDASRAYMVSQKKAEYRKYSESLGSSKDIKLISSEFSAIITSYCQAEILSRSDNITIFDSIKRFITTPRITTAIKQFVDKRIEKHITGVDDKAREIDIAYKAHWDEMIDVILIHVLANLNDITYDDIENYTAAVKLSSSLTPSSNAPLKFNAETNDSLDYNNVNTLARLALLAYDTERKIQEISCKKWLYSEESSTKRYYFVFESDIQGFVLADSDKIIVTFRGTATTANKLLDANVRPSELLVFGLEETVRVHAGFKNATYKIWPKIKQVIVAFLIQFTDDAKKPQIWFTGHSLGGAMAMIAAFNCVYSEEKLLSENQVHLYTFGQPKVGTKSFIQALEKKVSDYQRFVNYLDIVPTIPPFYKHGGQLQWLNSKGMLHDAIAYNEVMPQLDRYGKKVVRDNTINILMHTDNHSMTGYVARLGALVPADSTIHAYSSYQYNCHKLNEKLSLKPKYKFRFNLIFGDSRKTLMCPPISAHCSSSSSTTDDSQSDMIPKSDLDDLGKLMGYVESIADQTNDISNTPSPQSVSTMDTNLGIPPVSLETEHTVTSEEYEKNSAQSDSRNGMVAHDDNDLADVTTGNSPKVINTDSGTPLQQIRNKSVQADSANGIDALGNDNVEDNTGATNSANMGADSSLPQDSHAAGNSDPQHQSSSTNTRPRITGYESIRTDTVGMTKKERAEHHFKWVFRWWTDPFKCQKSRQHQGADCSEVHARINFGVVLSPFLILGMVVGSPLHIKRLYEYCADEDSNEPSAESSSTTQARI